MAEFKKAYNITLNHEGGYSNDTDDAGGETYKGISRKFNPGWIGWQVIDNCKKRPIFPDNIKETDILLSMVKKFYKNNYWDLFSGDNIPDQFVANELFDTSVNLGISRSIKFIQKSLNVLNRNQSIYIDIDEDGIFGKNTMKVLKTYLKTNSAVYLLKIMNILQGYHYIKYMGKNPKQEKFIRGWLNRVEITKTYK